MLECTDRHGSKDLIEEYCLNRLGPADLVNFEIHLLTCRDCQERVSDMDDLIVCVKVALGKQAALGLPLVTSEENSHVISE